MHALEDCAEDVAAAVRRHLPPDPPIDVPDDVDAPEPAVPAVSIEALDPTAFEGKRLALLVRRGDVAQAATDILVRATPDPDSDGARTNIFSKMSLGHEGVHLSNAADGVLALRQSDAEDLRTLAAVLGALALRGHLTSPPSSFGGSPTTTRPWPPTSCRPCPVPRHSPSSVPPPP